MFTATDTIELRHLPARSRLSRSHQDSTFDKEKGASRDEDHIPPHLDEQTACQGSEQQLHPADGGAAAWRFLFGAFMVEALQWG